MTIATDARRVVRSLPTPRVPGADASRRGSPTANASAVRIRRRRAARTPASPCRSGATPSQSTAGWRALFPRIDFRLHRAPPDHASPLSPAEPRRDERAGAFGAEEGQDRYGTRRHRAGDPRVRPSGSRISLSRAVSSQASFGRFFAIENRATPRFSTRTSPVPRGGFRRSTRGARHPRKISLADGFFLSRRKTRAFSQFLRFVFARRGL